MGFDPFALDIGEASESSGDSWGRQEATPVATPRTVGPGLLTEVEVRTAMGFPPPESSNPLLPSPRDERWLYKGLSDELPSWVLGFREHQWQATVECVDAFRGGAGIVILDAPTGSGKTLIAELVARELRASAAYVCSNKGLQDQFVADFPYAKVLKGRSNYPTLSMPYPEYSAADCTKEGSGEEMSCMWCPMVSECPYEIAKREALRARLMVINTSYLLTEANYVGNTSGRKLGIADECDQLEGNLMGFVTYSLTEGRLDRLRIKAPKKGVRKKTILAWLADELEPTMAEYYRSIPHTNDIRAIREHMAMSRLMGDTKRVIRDLTVEVSRAGGGEQEGAENWVRDNDAGPLVMKPVRVDEYGGETLWQHADKWLCMSATIISPAEFSESLGIDKAGIEYEVVSVPMMFPVENRKIIVAPVANMVNSLREQEWPKLLMGVRRVMEKHPDERILVHTVSYQLAAYLREGLSSNRVITYASGRERDMALMRYSRSRAGVLLAPSMDRGVDLKDDLCRVVVVAKVPFPNLGDRQVSSRLRGPGGQAWYNVQTVRTLVQMTGRGVRSESDWCRTYILDSQFLSNTWKKCKGLLPGWWREAVEVVRIKEYQ